MLGCNSIRLGFGSSFRFGGNSFVWWFRIRLRIGVKMIGLVLNRPWPGLDVDGGLNAIEYANHFLVQMVVLLNRKVIAFMAAAKA